MCSADRPVTQFVHCGTMGCEELMVDSLAPDARHRLDGLPSGTVTFLFTDLEGSTRLWEDFPEAMRHALARHDAILRDAVASHDGRVVKTTGDGVHGVFANPRD